MHRMALFQALVACCAVVMGSVASAQVNLPRSIINSSSIGPRDRDIIRQFCEQWVSDLSRGNREQVVRIRRELTGPVNDQPSQAFRAQYSDTLIPMLEPLIRNPDRDDHIAINALQIVGLIKTDSALSLMVDMSDSRQEPHWPMRRMAAKMATYIIGDAFAGEITLNQTRLQSMLRNIEQASERETHWAVLIQQFESLAAYPDAFGRSRWLGAVGSALNRMQIDPDAHRDFIRAIHHTLHQFRDRFLTMSESDRRTVGAQVAPLLVDLLEVADTDWSGGHSSDAVSATYSAAINNAEILLGTIDPLVRSGSANPATPTTTLREAWDDDTRASFQGDVEAWRRVIETGSGYQSR